MQLSLFGFILHRVCMRFLFPSFFLFIAFINSVVGFDRYLCAVYGHDSCIDFISHVQYIYI